MGKKWGRTKVIFDDHMDDIARDFEGGAELREIATKYDVSPPTITNWLIAAGYKHRKKGRYPKAMKERANDLAARGWDPIAIANLFQTKLDYVEEWIGMAPRPRGRAQRQAAPMETGYRRHVTGRRWTSDQKDEVMRLLQAGVFTVDQIYRLTNASRVRQQRIWRERSGAPFPLARTRPPRPAEDVTALVPIVAEGQLERATPAEIDAAIQRLEEQKRFLDQGA